MSDTPIMVQGTDNAGPGAQAEAPPRELKYQAFISYRCDVDAAIAGEILRSLETYAIPLPVQRQYKTGKRCGRCFMDHAELAAVSSLPDAIKAALDDSKFLIVVCSPAARDRPWINQEIEYFLASGRRNRLLAVLVEGEPELSFPEALLESNPLAVDLRAPSRSARSRLLKTEKLRLLASIIGCDFDTLRDREGDRTRARLRLIASLASAVAIAALFVVAYVLQLRAASERARVIAESRLATASQALDEVNHIVGDHADDADLASIRPALLSVVSKARRALSTSGADGRDEHLIDLMTHLQRGDIARSHHDGAGAAQEYRTALEIAVPALQSHPKDVPLRQDIALLHERLATIALEARDEATAASELDLSIKMDEEILRDTPEHLGVRENLAKGYNQRGAQKERQGASGASDDYTKAIEVVGTATDDSGKLVLESVAPLALAHRRRGYLFVAGDHLEEGLADLRKARDLSEQGMETFPTRYPPIDLVGDYIALGRAEVAAERLPDAVNDLDAALKFLNQWRKQNPESVASVDDVWQINAILLPALARLHRSDELARQVDEFLVVDDERQSRLEHTASAVEQYVPSAVELAMTMDELGQRNAAVKIGMKALVALNRSMEGEKSRLRESRLLIGVLPTLVAIIGEGPVLPPIRAAVEQCRGKATGADLDGALRCGYRAMMFGRLAMALGDRKSGQSASLVAMQFAERLEHEPGPDALRLRVAATYLATLVAVSDSTPDRARALSAAGIRLGRELATVDRVANEPPGVDDRFDPALLAEALLISVFLTDKERVGDAEIEELREAVALLEPIEDATGNTRLDAASARMMLAQIDFAREDFAKARQEADALNALVDGASATNLLAFGAIIAEALIFDTELAAKTGDKPFCDAAVKKLESAFAATPKGIGAVAPVLTAARERCAALAPSH